MSYNNRMYKGIESHVEASKLACTHVEGRGSKSLPLSTSPTTPQSQRVRVQNWLIESNKK